MNLKENCVIRNYYSTDKEEILKIFRLNTPAYFSPEEEKDLNHYLDLEIDMYFVLEMNGKIVGSGGINLSDDRKNGIISWDLLHPDFQRKGLGNQLLQYRLNKLKEMQTIDRIIVRTSQLVYPFYEKNGFQLKEIVKDYWAEGFDLYFMERKKM